MLEHAPDVGEEAHVEHPVRLIEHEHFELVELRVRMPEVIEQPSRRRDQNVDAAAERVLLRAHPHTAEDRGAFDGRVRCELTQMLLDLRRELARRGEHERARHTPLRAGGLRHDALHDGQQEGGGLAASGHRAREHVAPFEGGRNGVVLNGRGAGEAEFFHAAHEGSVETECRKGHPRSLTAPRDR